MSTATTIAVPPAPVASSVLDLVDRSRACLLEALHQQDVLERYRCAQLGALRAAAALIAARSRRSGRSRPRSAWDVVTSIAPELGEWAAFFADTGRRCHTFDTTGGRPSSREADDLIRQAELFLGLVLQALGLPMAARLAADSVPVRWSAGAVS